jgi:hypothetical protein
MGAREESEDFVRTIEQARAIVKSISFRAGVGMWSPKLELAEVGDHWGGYALSISVHVPNRDGGGLGTVNAIVPAPPLGYLPRRAYIEFVFRSYLQFVEHEAMESFRVDGELFVDPHASDK